jgi:hypothetical protein
MEVTKNLMVTDRAPEFFCGDGKKLPEGQESLQHSTNQAFLVEWPDGSHSSVKGMTAHLEFAKRHLKDSQTMRNKIIWSDETKIELTSRLEETRHSSSPGQYHPYEGSMVVVASCYGDVFQWQKLVD